MSSPDGLSPDEQRAYDLITEEGELTQSQLWKALDVNSRTGSKLATSLADKGLITREQTVHNGQPTYLLRPTEDVRDNDPTTTWQGQTGPADSAPTEPGSAPDSALTRREQAALELVRETGGIYQSALWKELDVSSRTGSRIATALAEKELIRREETIHNGRRTYLLEPAPRDLDFSLLMAGNEISPFIGVEGDLDPLTSGEVTKWLMHLAREDR